MTVWGGKYCTERNAYQLIHHLRFLRVALGHVLWMQSRRKCQCIKRRNIVFVHWKKWKYFCSRENVSYVSTNKVIDNCNNLFGRKKIWGQHRILQCLTVSNIYYSAKWDKISVILCVINDIKWSYLSLF